MVLYPPTETRLASGGLDAHGGEQLVVELLQFIAGEEIEWARALLLQLGGLTIEMESHQRDAHNNGKSCKKYEGKLSGAALRRLIHADVRTVHHAAKLLLTGDSRGASKCASHFMGGIAHASGFWTAPTLTHR